MLVIQGNKSFLLVKFLWCKLKFVLKRFPQIYLETFKINLKPLKPFLFSGDSIKKKNAIFFQDRKPKVLQKIRIRALNGSLLPRNRKRKTRVLNGSVVVSNTLQGTNISPKNGILKMIFLFPRWDVNSLEGIFCFHPYLGKIPILTSIFFNWVGSPPTSEREKEH